MADLSELNASLPTKIVGAASTGGETNFVNADSNGSIFTLVKDTLGNGITSTSINSKQRFDVNSASDGVDGATAPFQTTQIGGKDASGNLQSIVVDANGAISVNAIASLAPSVAVSFTAGVASSTLVSGNAARKGLIVTNLSANRVSLNLLNATAVLNAGITLLPGWVWYMDNYSFTINTINIIASGASSIVSVQEFS